MQNKASKKSISIRISIDAVRKDSNSFGFEKWRKIGEIIVADMKQRGQFFFTNQGLFYFDSEEHRVLTLQKDDIGLAALLNQRYGINAKEHGFVRVLADLISEAFLRGRKSEIRRLAHYDQAKQCLYVSRFEQRKLLKLWTVSVFFGSIQPTKVILLLLGEHGSGKTSTLRRIQKLIFGNKADLLSIEKEKPDGFVATVTTDPLALFDNLDERIHWLPYALSRLATGVTFSRRVLYTTNQRAQFPGVSWLGITARSVDFMAEQPDLPDRTLVLAVERLDDKKPEGELISAVSQHRNAMWSELLDQLNSIVRRLREPAQPVAVKFRMADFACFALQVSTVWGCRDEVEAIFKKLEDAQADLVFDNEPIHQVLDLWLASEANHGRELEAGTLWRECSRLAAANEIAWPFADGRALGRRLKQLRHALKQKFDLNRSDDKHAKQHRYQFWPKGESRAQQPVSGPAQSGPEPASSREAQPAGYAGNAG